MQKSDKPLLWAGSGKADNNSDFTALMCYVLGARCKIIVGYKGTGDMNIAIQRGEVDGRIISDESAALYAAPAGMRVVATLARKRSDLFPDVPTLFEAADLNAEQKRLIDKFYRCLNPEGYLFVGHAESLLGMTEKFQMVHRNSGKAR